MSGGEGILGLGVVVIVVVCTLAAPFPLVHAYRLIGSGHNVAGWLWAVAGGVFSLPIMILLVYFIIKVIQAVMDVGGRKR